MAVRPKLLLALAGFMGCALLAPALFAVAGQAPPDGRALFQANCAACHGAEGRGDRKPSDLGFQLQMPDFGDCSFATREADGDWASTIHRGGRARAFARQMPAFDQALSEEEIDAIIGYLRSLCARSGYPRGEFNLPLAMFTEKAFPEDELVVQSAIAAKGLATSTTSAIFEKRVGKRGQFEVNVPFATVDGADGAHAGLGDIGLAWKQNLVADVDKGRIFTLLGEAVLPTGSETRGLGAGATTFEAHALFAQLLPRDFFLQGDVFGEFPTAKGAPDEVQARFALGRTFAEDEGFGRAWSPQLEFLAAHELGRGAGVDLDLVPQLQVSLSRRQHILFSAGGRFPLNNRDERKPQVVFYLIWDWFDGGLFSGW